MKAYRKTGTTLMMPWSRGIDMTGVSISDADKENGSPKWGDMIAENPNDSNDRWLVEKGYFMANYEEAFTMTLSPQDQERMEKANPYLPGDTD